MQHVAINFGLGQLLNTFNLSFSASLSCERGRGSGLGSVKFNVM